MSSQGSFNPDREKDELTLALGNKEHPGRTRGVGLVNWKVGFLQDVDNYRSRKRKQAEKEEMLREMEARLKAERDHVMRNVNVMIQSAVQVALSQKDNPCAGTPRVPSTPYGKSSSVSVGHPFDPTKCYPVDKITRVTPCKLYVPVFNMSIKVAEGMASQWTEGQLLHNRPILAGYAKVSLDRVLNKYVNLSATFMGSSGKSL